MKSRCNQCQEPVEVAEGGVFQDLLASMQARLQNQGDRLLEPWEMVRCPKCHEAWSKARSEESMAQMAHYQRLTGELCRGKYRRMDRGTDRDGYMADIREVAPDWESDAWRALNEYEAAKEASKARRGGGDGGVPE